MALTGYDPQEVVPFYSKYDKTEPRVVFWVRHVLDKRADIDTEDNVWESKGMGKRQHQQWKAGSRRWKILEYMFTHSQARWENFNDTKGVPIPFSLQNIQMIEDRVKDELIDFVKPARLDEEDELD